MRKDEDSTPVAAAVGEGESTVGYYSPPHELLRGIMLDANGDAKALDIEEEEEEEEVNALDLAPKYDDYGKFLNSYMYILILFSP